MCDKFTTLDEEDVTIRLLTLYDALKKKGKIKTQREYCSYLGISEAFYTEIKKGRSGINTDKLHNISAELVEYREWLLTGKNSPFSSGKLKLFNNQVHNDLVRIVSGNIPAMKDDEIIRTDSGLVVAHESLWNSNRRALDFYENLDNQGRIDIDIPTEKRQLSIIENLQYTVKSQQRSIEELTNIIKNLTSK